MTSIADAPENPLPVGRSRSRRGRGGVIGWLRANLFSSIPSTVISLLLIFLLAKACVSLLQWGFWNAIWSVPDNQTGACRAIRGLGACWAVIPEKFRFILFGTYPFDQQWRPAVATLTFAALFFVSSRRNWWRKELVLVWGAALVAIGLLMWGGVFGLPFVSQDRWGGLPVTLMLATFGLAVGFPLGIVVALGRRSKLPAIRSLCVLYVELIRGVPLISLLFMASVMFPLFMPDGVNIDKLLRAQIAFVLFAGAYLAEVVRGGLQAIPRQQDEAAQALGFNYWQRMGFVILPQALRISIPPLVNTVIGFFKDTSLVVIIGLFDFLTAIKISLTEPTWSGFGVEAYLFAALGYFFFCFPMSLYSQALERRGARDTGVKTLREN